MRVVVSILGTEVLAVELGPARSDGDGLDEHGAPKVHETHLGGETEIGFQACTPWRHTEELM